MTSSTYCPLAWNHFSTSPNGKMRLCCNTAPNNPLVDNDGNQIDINKISNTLNYFNLDRYKEIRKNMMQGKESKECQICYDIEKNNGTSIRQYYVKEYPFENFKDITNQDTGEISNIKVNYLDLGWSNKCNLKCRMCSPWASDQLIPETKALHLMGMNFKEEEFNFSDKWTYESLQPIFEKVVTQELNEILVTGGEPLINNDFFKFCVMLNEKGYASNIRLSFHTNLTVMPEKWIKVLSAFKTVSFKVSIDGTGDCYEYVRYPGKWNIIKDNISELCNIIVSEKFNFSVEFHTVLSLHNAYGIVDLLDYLTGLPVHKRIYRLPHFNYVRQPWHAVASEIPALEKNRIFTQVEEWIVANSHKHPTQEDKISIIRAVMNIMIQSQPSNIQKTVFERIKMVDEYRGHNTDKFLPWVNKNL